MIPTGYWSLLNQQIQQQNQLNAPQALIPGLTGPTTNGAGIPGLLAAYPSAGPGLNQIPAPIAQPASKFMPTGPYGQQAMQMAGLLPPTGGVGLLSQRAFRIPGSPYGK